MYDLILVLKFWTILSQTKKNEFMKEFLFDKNQLRSNEDFTTFLAKKFDIFDSDMLPQNYIDNSGNGSNNV